MNNYPPCTSILIEGLQRLEGGAEVLAEWDAARGTTDHKEMETVPTPTKVFEELCKLFPNLESSVGYASRLVVDICWDSAKITVEYENTLAIKAGATQKTFNLVQTES